jgi:hypothetical protein
MKTGEVTDKTDGDVARLRRWRCARGRMVGRSSGGALWETVLKMYSLLTLWPDFSEIIQP